MGTFLYTSVCDLALCISQTIRGPFLILHLAGVPLVLCWSWEGWESQVLALGPLGAKECLPVIQKVFCNPLRPSSRLVLPVLLRWQLSLCFRRGAHVGH